MFNVFADCHFGWAEGLSHGDASHHQAQQAPKHYPHKTHRKRIKSYRHGFKKIGKKKREWCIGVQKIHKRDDGHVYTLENMVNKKLKKKLNK